MAMAGKQGWLFPDGDMYGLADAIVHAVDQRDGLTHGGPGGDDGAGNVVEPAVRGLRGIVAALMIL